VDEPTLSKVEDGEASKNPAKAMGEELHKQFAETALQADGTHVALVFQGEGNG
jgi:hypothetical protein